jgi:hypothetical protein
MCGKESAHNVDQCYKFEQQNSAKICFQVFVIVTLIQITNQIHFNSYYYKAGHR